MKAYRCFSVTCASLFLTLAVQPNDATAQSSSKYACMEVNQERPMGCATRPTLSLSSRMASEHGNGISKFGVAA